MNEYLETIYKASKKYGLINVIFGGGTPDFMNDDPVVREKSMEYCENFYPRAYEMFGFEVCNLFLGTILNPSQEIEYADFTKHGSYIARLEHWHQANEGLKKLAAIAEKYDFRFALETHPNFLHDSVKSTVRLATNSGSERIGVNLDYVNANVLPGNISIENAIREINERLYYVHLKNVIKTIDGQRIRTGLGDGEYNNRHIVDTLIKSGYNGLICIEAPRQGDREWFARQDLAYMKSLMKDIG